MFSEQNDARGAKRKHCVLDDTIPATSSSLFISKLPPRPPRPEQRRGYYETIAGSIHWSNYFEWFKAVHDSSAASVKIQATLEADPSAPLNSKATTVLTSEKVWVVGLVGSALTH